MEEWQLGNWDDGEEDGGKDQSKSRGKTTDRHVELDLYRLRRHATRSATARGTRSGPATLIVVLLALSWVGGQVPAYFALSTRGSTATGLVTGEGQSCGDPEFACMDVVKVESETQDGRKITFWDGSLAGLESGDTVEVLYDTDNPTTAEIGGIGEQRGWVIVYGLSDFSSL